MEKIDITKLAIESAETPFIYSAKLNEYNEIIAKYKWVEMEYDSLYKDKFRYYLGKAEPSVYLNNPLPEKVLKSDVQIYINADPEIINIKKKLIGFEIKEKSISLELKELSSRSFHIRNIIEWNKFQAGS
jgi:hypothetical protein